MSKIYDQFVKRLGEEVAKIKVGPGEDNFRMGPVSSERAFKSIMKYIEIGKKENKLLYGGDIAPGNGFYIQPTIFIDVKPKDTLAQEEVFGPVLAVIKAETFENAIEIQNDTKYGLTGALYSKNPKKWEYAKLHFHCGNLYGNRKCTGALVGVHPFGGFNLSGTDSKAGGRDYLLLFLQAKATALKEGTFA